MKSSATSLGNCALFCTLPFLPGHAILNREVIHNLNRPVTWTEIKLVIKALPTNISPGPDDFPAEFYQTFQKELNPILHKLLKEIK